MIIHSIVQWCHRRSTCLLENNHTSHLSSRPSYNLVNECKQLFNGDFSVVINGTTRYMCGITSCTQLIVAIWTWPHPVKHCVIFWWLMLSAACGLSAMNNVICLLGVLASHDQNCDFVVPNVHWIIQITDIQIVINIVFAVGETLDKPSNVILLLPLNHCVPLSQVNNSVDFWSLVFLHLLDIYFG